MTQILTLSDLVLLIEGGTVVRAGVVLQMTPYDPLPVSPEDREALLKKLRVLAQAFTYERDRLNNILYPNSSTHTHAHR